jgi:hypothetical protein
LVSTGLQRPAVPRGSLTTSMNILMHARHTARNSIVSGSCASIVSTLVLSACSKIEEDSAAGAINGPSQWLWGRREGYRRAATLRHTAVGNGIHHLMSIFWAALHEGAFGPHLKNASPLKHCAAAALTTATAYLVDYNLTPRRLQPGFEKHLGPWSMAAVYGAFAIGLAAATMYRERRKTFGPG